MTESTANSFVLFPMGKKRFALPSQFVTELARPDRLQTFPHTTPLLVGVLVRRGRIIPVCDVAEVLVGPDAPARKFFLIAMRGVGAGEWLAVPVTGECELIKGKIEPPPDGSARFVTGLLTLRGEAIEVVDIEKLISDHSAHAAILCARKAEVSA
jgi:chemotaxis signal transduction protein